MIWHLIWFLNRMDSIKYFVLIFIVITTSCSAQRSNFLAKPITGASQINEYLDLLKGKQVAIVANQTSTIGRTHLIDTLVSLNINVKVIFAPEHGFRGTSEAGENVKDGFDNLTKLQVISLYGDHQKPSDNDLKNIDIVVFDIQDVGVRFYTYISTLQYVMESCAHNNIPLIILDRPNPHGGYVDGPVLKSKFKSFVGMQSIPVVYGMTVGEYALMLNGEYLLNDSMICNLKIIKLLNWDHSTYYVLPINPSPNLPNKNAVNLYPSLCFFEGTKISVGRGTLIPFQVIGSPENVKRKYDFSPKSILGMSLNPPYQGLKCYGLNLVKEGLVNPKKINLSYLLEMYSDYKDKHSFFNNFFDKLAGTDELRLQIINNFSEEKIRDSWVEGLSTFKSIRKKYLLYKDFE